MAQKTSSEVVKQSFITVDILKEKFKYASARLPILDKTSLELKVESDEQLTIAENNAVEAASLLKEVDSVRKLLIGPYADTIKMTNFYCKTISDNLERIKLRFTSQITDYKVIKEAQAKVEREKKLKELEILETEKREESAKITRIEAKLVAEIYGGSYTTKNGESKIAKGCTNESDCSNLLSFINQNAPDPKDFKHFQGTYEDMIISVKKKLADHKINLIDLHKEDAPIAREGAMRRITEQRVEAVQDITANAQEAEKIIVKETKSEVRSMDREVKEAGKGVRGTLAYDITDENLVPRDMLSVDEKKINRYVNVNKENIKDKLSRNEEIIPGIRFFVDNNFIAR
jgi:hypothetical protein